MSNKILLGQSQYGEVYFAEVKDGLIKGFDGYMFIDKDQSYDENNYLHHCSWTHSITINGLTYTSGVKLAENIEPFFQDEDIKQIILNDECYYGEGSFCSDCGIFHDTEQYHNVSYTILDDCELYCKTCVGGDELIADTPVESVDDIYKAKDIVGLEVEDYEEVHTIFHDCGWGGPATSHKQSVSIVDDLLEEHGELYAGLTGIGQFQVYVTLYKKIA